LKGNRYPEGYKAKPRANNQYDETPNDIEPVLALEDVSCGLARLPVPERLGFVKRGIGEFCRKTYSR